MESSSSWDETLLIVTADHETGYLTGKQNSYADIVNSGKELCPKCTGTITGLKDMYMPGCSGIQTSWFRFMPRERSEAFYEVADEKTRSEDTI